MGTDVESIASANSPQACGDYGHLRCRGATRRRGRV